jgi:hypothetical protein
LVNGGTKANRLVMGRSLTVAAMRNETLEGAAALVRGEVVPAGGLRDERRQVVGDDGHGGQLGEAAVGWRRAAAMVRGNAGVNHDLAAAGQEHYGDRINRLLD